jgi:CHAT domain-containing protein
MRLMHGAGYIHLATHGFFAPPGDEKIFQRDPRQLQLFDRLETTAGLRGATLAGRNPLLLSGVALAGANLGPVKDEYGAPKGEDGILTAEEVESLDLDATELVVLSACETGLGEVAGGEGVFGLQRSFHQAGARTVIASLWKVDDAATQALMTEFYRNLWDPQRKLGKLEALRQAQLTILRNYDPKTGAARGTVGQLKPLVEPAPPQPAPSNGNSSLPPYFWAAFTLSGDWR